MAHRGNTIPQKNQELHSFLEEADKNLTKKELKKRASEGCEYSTYLQNPTPHHGAYLKANPPELRKPKMETEKEEVYYAPVPTAKTNVFMNKKNKELTESQILMQKRMSNPSADALQVLWRLGDKLEVIQKGVLKLRETPNKPMALIKAKQELAQLNGELEVLQFDGIDAVVTAELKSGRTAARDERKRLTNLAEETHELIHVVSLDLKNRFVDAGPDIKLAWKYFKTVTLPNRVLKPGTKDDFRKLEPGEIVDNSEQYGVWDTPVKEIGDFGIGILLYFKMLIGLGCLALFLGLISVYNIDYFKSSSYSSLQASISSISIVKGSAICDDYIAVCLTDTCSCTVDTSVTPPTIASVSGDCAFKKNCDFKAENAYVSLAIAGVFLLFNFYMGWSHDKITTEADEAEQTAQDYSIMVNDPDGDATDPDEWQKFFSQWGHVSYVTIAYNNGELLTLLAERKSVLRSLSFEDVVQSNDKNKKKKTEDDFLNFNHDENAKLYEELGFFKKKVGGLVQHRNKLLQIDDKIQKLVTGTKNISKACKVFVVFEKESSQRRCLTQLTVGSIPAMMDSKSSSMPERFVFRGTNVLDVCEAPEPTDIIWENLEVTTKHKMIEQSITFVISMGIIALCGLIIHLFHKADSTGVLAAVFISVTNFIMPIVLKAINEQEKHWTQGSKQTSLLLKLVFLRWMTTGFIMLIVNDAAKMLDEEFIGKIRAIIWADAVTTPIIRLADPAARIGRRFLAAKAPTQEKMNSYFLGSSWFLAERYTDMTKTMFVSLFFVAIFPQGLFITAAAFTMSYWVDKYCLFRLWKQPPAMDGTLASAARFQISLIFLIHCLVTQHFFMGWPFDNVESTSSTSVITLNNGNAETGTKYESVDKVSYNVFDFGNKSWYSEDQKQIVFIYGILNIVSISIFVAWYFGHSFKYGFHKLFYGNYRSVGEARDDEFSFVPGIQTYVPMVCHNDLGLPLLACSLGTFDHSHISFTMKNYSSQDLSISNAFRNVSSTRKRKCFGSIKQYKSQRLMDHEIETVEVDMNTIAEWEKSVNMERKKMMQEGGKIHEIGGLGETGGRQIGGVKHGLHEEQKKVDKKRSSLFGFGGDSEL